MVYKVFFFGDNSQYGTFLIITQFLPHLLENPQIWVSFWFIRASLKEKFEVEARSFNCSAAVKRKSWRRQLLRLKRY